MFTKQHYEAIAQAVNDATLIDLKQTRNATIDKPCLLRHLVGIFTADNPRFDPERFREACNR